MSDTDILDDYFGSRSEGDAHPAEKLRVLFHLRLREGAEQQFLDAYEAVRHVVAAVPGHVVDQVCQSADDPDEWLITSEWESPAHFSAWVRSAEHRELAAPLVACSEFRRSARYSVRRTTSAAHGHRPAPEAAS